MGRPMYEASTLKEVVSRKKNAEGKVVTEKLECGHWVDVTNLIAKKLARRCPQCPPKAKRSR